MKKYLLVVILFLVLIPVSSACSGGVETTPLPIGGLPDYSANEQADDVIGTPGGWAYRANVIQEGTQNPWPPIEVTQAVMGTDDDVVHAFFRAGIESKAGDIRSNIITIAKGDGSITEEAALELYTVELPAGIVITECGNGEIRGPGSLGAVVTITIADDIAPGEYNADIGIKVNGTNYGLLPCKVTVTQ